MAAAPSSVKSRRTPRIRVVLQIIVVTMLMLFSYTFSMMLVAINIMLGLRAKQIAETKTGDATVIRAVDAAVPNALQFASTLVFSCFFAMSIVASWYYGELSERLNHLLHAFAQEINRLNKKNDPKAVKETAETLRTLIRQHVEKCEATDPCITAGATATTREANWVYKMVDPALYKKLLTLPSVLTTSEVNTQLGKTASSQQTPLDLIRNWNLLDGVYCRILSRILKIPQVFVYDTATNRYLINAKGMPELFPMDAFATEGEQRSLYFAAGLGQFAPLAIENTTAITPENILDSLEKERAATLRVTWQFTRVYRNGVTLAVPTLIPIIGSLFSEQILKAWGQNPAVATEAASFLKIYAFAWPLIVIRLLAEQMLLAAKQTKAVTAPSFTSFLLSTAAASYLCFFGSPKLGIPSIPLIATSYTIGELVNVFVFSLSLFWKLSKFRFVSVRNLLHCDKQQDRQQLKDMAKIAAPMTLNMLIEQAGGFLISMLLGIKGEEKQAAQMFSTGFGLFAFMLIFAAAQAASQEVARKRGANNPLDASRFARWGAATSVGMLLIPSVLVSIFARTLIPLLTSSKDSETNNLSVLFTWFAAIIAVSDALRLTLISSARATGDPVIPTIYSIACLFGGFAFSGITGFATPLGAVGIGLGPVVGSVSGTIAVTARCWPRLGPEALQKITNPSANAIEPAAVVTPQGSTNSLWRAATAFWRRSTIKGEETPLLSDNDFSQSKSGGVEARV